MSSITTVPTTTGARRLLLAGVVAGPIYVVTSLSQALTRDGFDPSRHPWSMLANGGLGWIQICNLFLTGLLVVLFALGLRRTLTSGRGATWVPRLIGLFGVGMILASFFRADPALGFPPGTPADYQQMSWHGALHMLAASIGFVGVIVACLIMSRRFAARSERGWSFWSAVTGLVFIGGLIGLSATGSALWMFVFTGAVVLVFTWLTALAVRAHTGQSI